MRILWELRDGPLGFRELQQRCNSMSSSVLSDRLGELREAGLVERDSQDRHHVTDLGRSLHAALSPLEEWADDWASQLSDRPSAVPAGDS